MANQIKQSQQPVTIGNNTPGLTFDNQAPSQVQSSAPKAQPTPQPTTPPITPQATPTPTTPPAKNSQVDPQDQATITKWRAAGLSDQQIAVGLMRKKQMLAVSGYNSDGTPSTDTSNSGTQQNYDPFGGRTKQQVLATAFQSGITDATSLANIGKTYDLVTNGGQTDQLAALKTDVANKMTFGAAIQKYGGSMSPDTILKTYNDNSPFGQASSASIQSAKEQGHNITGSSDAAMNQDLKDAQAAIDQGANPTAVKKRFMQIHPSSSAAFNNYVQ